MQNFLVKLQQRFVGMTGRCWYFSANDNGRLVRLGCFELAGQRPRGGGRCLRSGAGMSFLAAHQDEHDGGAASDVRPCAGGRANVAGLHLTRNLSLSRRCTRRRPLAESARNRCKGCRMHQSHRFGAATGSLRCPGPSRDACLCGRCRHR